MFAILGLLTSRRKNKSKSFLAQHRLALASKLRNERGCLARCGLDAHAQSRNEGRPLFSRHVLAPNDGPLKVTVHAPGNHPMNRRTRACATNSRPHTPSNPGEGLANMSRTTSYICEPPTSIGVFAHTLEHSPERLDHPDCSQLAAPLSPLNQGARARCGPRHRRSVLATPAAISYACPSQAECPLWATHASRSPPAVCQPRAPSLSSVDRLQPPF